jgi:hypothetical protein
VRITVTVRAARALAAVSELEGRKMTRPRAIAESTQLVEVDLRPETLSLAKRHRRRGESLSRCIERLCTEQLERVRRAQDDGGGEGFAAP